MANSSRAAQTVTLCTGTATTTDSYYSAEWQLLEEDVTTNPGCGPVTVTASQYVWGLGYIDDLVLRDDDSSSGNLGKASSGLGRRIYVLQDANYDVTALTDTIGTVLERLMYDPYGSITVLTASWGSTTDAYGWEYFWQGGRYDTTTQLYNFRYRDYDPALGAWTEQDPLRYVNGPDVYQMELSNPVNGLDPFGQAEHTKGARKSTQDQHEATRSGDAELKDDRMEYSPTGGNEAKDAARAQREEAAAKQAAKEASEAAKAAKEAEKAAMSPEAKEALEKALRDLANQLDRRAAKKAASKLSKCVPWLGAAIAVAEFATNRAAKGNAGAVANAALDAIPGISDLKAAGELATGQDLIPDQNDLPGARTHDYMQKNNIPEATDYGLYNDTINGLRILDDANRANGLPSVDPFDPPNQ